MASWILDQFSVHKLPHCSFLEESRTAYFFELFWPLALQSNHTPYRIFFQWICSRILTSKVVEAVTDRKYYSKRTLCHFNWTFSSSHSNKSPILEHTQKVLIYSIASRNLFMSSCTLFWDIILGHYFGMKVCYDNR
jgi:hypothetical protein